MLKLKHDFIALNESSSLFFDLLRVLLSQAVLLGHATSFYGVMGFLSPPNFPWIQSIAVVGFFWLSGFLIFYSVQMKASLVDGYGFKSFFIDRFSRIYSAYIPAMVFVFLVDYCFVNLMPDLYGFYGAFTLGNAIDNLFMLQKHPVPFFSAPMFGSASAWWSLSIEWWLYMFFGALVFYRSSRFKIFLAFVIALSFVVPLNYAVLGNGYVGIGLSLSWFLACYMAFSKDILIRALSPFSFFCLSIVLFFLALIRYRFSMDSYDFIASIYFGGGLIFMSLFFHVLNFNVVPLFKKVVGFLAGYSFTLFLVHYSVIYFFVNLGFFSGWEGVFFVVVLSNAVAAAIAFFTEFNHKKLSMFLKRTVGRVGV